MRTLLALALASLLAPSAARAASPNLTFDQVSAVYVPADDSVDLTITIKNNSTTWVTTAFYLDVFADDTDWEECKLSHAFVRHTTGLAPGAVKSYVFTIESGYYDEQVYFFLDADRFVAELNEGDNQGLAYLLPADPGEPARVQAWLNHNTAECMRDRIFDDFGWMPALPTRVFYTKHRVL